MAYAASGALTFLPVLLYVTGLILAIVTRARHPRRSTFAAIAFALLVVDGLLGTVWIVSGPMFLSHGWSTARYSAFTVVIGTVETLLLLAGLALLLVALFGKERHAPTQPAPAQLRQPQQPPFPGQRPPGY